MSRLILVRHAAPEIDPDHAAANWPLSFEGRAAATALAAELAAYDPSVVVTSQLPKAFETGRILAEHLGIPVRTGADLHELERRYVPWLGSREFAAKVADSMARPDERVFGEESASGARLRFERALDAALEAHPHETVVIVTHGTVMALYVAARAGADPFAVWSGLGMPAYAVLTRPGLTVERVVNHVA
jgi:broad specificity phosphatase PhoE